MSKVHPELEIVKYEPSEFDFDYYKPDLMDMEIKCFHENIQADWGDMQSLIEDSISCYFVLDRSVKIVGIAYAIPMENEEDIDTLDPHHDYWVDMIRKYAGQKVAYLYSISIHPDYAGKDLAKRLMISILSDCKNKMYDCMLSHAKEGASLHLHDFFGGLHINSVSNWYDTGATHTLCSINLHNTFMIPLHEPIGQDSHFDCGIAAMENLLHYKGISYDRQRLVGESGVNKQGTTHDGMAYALGNSSHEPVLVMDDETPDMKTLVSLISHGFLVIIHVLSPGTYEGHYLLIIGANDQSFYTWDVYDSLFGRMSKQELERVWWNNTTKTSCGIALPYILKDGTWVEKE
jgi:GNAT superfamily N-acetyltransferase